MNVPVEGLDELLHKLCHKLEGHREAGLQLNKYWLGGHIVENQRFEPEPYRVKVVISAAYNA